MNLSNVQLKHVTHVNDKSAPNFVSMSDADVHSHIGNLLDFNIEHWLALLGEFTFATELVPMTVADAQMLRDACEHYQRDGALLQASDRAALDDWARRLEAPLARMTADNGDRGAFCKLSSRSAKDAPGLLRQLDDVFRARCTPLDSENRRLTLLFEIATDFMRMRSTRQIVDSLVCSERILQDMNVALQRLDRFDENVVIRRWVDIGVDMEFRGFVSNGRLTALSQYNHVIHSERVVSLQAEILRLIDATFREQIQPRLAAKFTSYVIDFALTGGRFGASPAEPERVWVIELNPFLTSTDAALFSWRNDGDLLRSNPNAPEFCIRTSYETSVRAQLEIRWRDLLVAKK
jgi:hypothetical protein